MPTSSSRAPRRSAQWQLQEAKAKFSELIRRAQNEGPQHVTIHGREGVVVLTAEEFRRLRGGLTGRELIKAIQASPYRSVEIEPERSRMPVRDVNL